MPETIIQINPHYSNFAPVIEYITANGLPASAEIIYDKRNKVARLTVDGINMIIKAFRCPGFINSIAYTTVRGSKALRSYENSLKLLEAGFNVPQPIAYSEVRKGLRLRESYYFSTEISGDDLRYWERRADADELSEALAHELVKLTDAGICHLDLSPGNMMFTRNAATGEYSFSYIDLNRMEFDVKDRRRLLKSIFERLNEMDPILDLAGRFARISGDNSGYIERYARKVRGRYERNRELKRKLKSIWKK
ncbi:MAG: lipopolysaccharide kinase InaA family protein [Duncaniella sp.]|nr:lipopolysaccharide kinase InaA family protein [Duncaniella sp.]